MKNLPTLAEVRKAVVAVAAFAAQMLALGLLPPRAVPYVTAALAFLTAVGVYAVPNGKKAPAVPPVGVQPRYEIPAAPAPAPAPAPEVPQAPEAPVAPGHAPTL